MEDGRFSFITSSVCSSFPSSSEMKVGAQVESSADVGLFLDDQRFVKRYFILKNY